MKKHKVLFLIESLIVGGAEKVLVDIVNNMDAEKFDITVCSVYKYSVYDSYQEYFDKPFAPQIHHKCLVNNHNKPACYLFNALLKRFPNALYKGLVGDGYDSVVAFYEGLPTSWIASARLKRGKKFAWLHTTAALSQAGKTQGQLLKEARKYSVYDRVVAVSNLVKSSFCQTFPTLNISISVIYNPVDAELVQRRSKEKVEIPAHKSPLFVAVGRMTYAKGFDRWLKCLGSLKRKGYDFSAWIIGGGNQSELKKIISDEDLSDCVCLMGHQPNPFPFIREADWVVAPSRIEGLPTVILESLVLGKAIMGTDGTGIAELLKGGKIGLLVSNDAESIEQGMENILNHPELESIYETKANDYAGTFSLQSTINQIETLFLV